MTAKSRQPRKRSNQDLSLGKWLRQQRLRRGISLPKVAAETHIQLGVLRAIEAEQYRGLPHNVHTLGFVRRYAKFLGQDMAAAAAKYKDLRGPLPRPSGQLRKQRVRGPIATARLLLIGLVSVGLVVVGVYLVWQIRVLTAAPDLSLAQPADNQTIASAAVAVQGQTTPGADVSVNGQPQIVDGRGHFSSSINLPSGVNTIIVRAQNKRGKSTTLERSVLIQPPQP